MQVSAKRIVVIGTSCAGKTTLARALSEKLKLPHIELDALHWGPNWTPNPDFVDRVHRAVANESWVICGNYGTVRGLIWDRADLILWLDYEMGVVLGRALRRTIGRAWSQEPMWAGNRESFRLSFASRDSILLWVLTTWRKRRHTYRKLFSTSGKHADKPVIQLKTPAATFAFLGRISGDSRAASTSPNPPSCK